RYRSGGSGRCGASHRAAGYGRADCRASVATPWHDKLRGRLRDPGPCTTRRLMIARGQLMDTDTEAYNLAKTGREPARETAGSRSAVIIANPASGSFPQHHAHSLNETLSFLSQRDWHVDLYITKAPGAARQLAHEAVTQDVDIVIAAGGDGTINEIIQELAGSKTALGVLPYGTG